MDLTSPKEIRKSYLEILASDANYNNVFMALVNKKENEPIYNYNYLNPEDAISYDNEQRELSEILLDLNSVNMGIIEIKNRAAELFNSINSQAEQIQSSVQQETERIMDINMVCGNDSQYNMCIPIDVSYFNTEDGFEYIGNKTIGAKLNNQNEVEYSITSISGNGYSGNNYVYNYETNTFQNEEDDRSNYDLIKDDNNVTAYEYSRLITSSKEEAIDSLINYDDKPCECVILLTSNDPVCKAEIVSDNKNLIIKNIEVSNDGNLFTSWLTNPISFNNLEAIYNDSTYIYGSNTICFPYTNYVRITFSSDTIENDAIALKDGDEIISYPNTKRKKIAINSIKLYSSSYSDITITSSNILEAGSVDKISLFATEYIPDHFNDNNLITYYLIINGTEYEVVPVNSGYNDVKIIKFSEQDNFVTEDYIQNISETIKSAAIKISIKAYQNDETPYISNLKLCLGKDTGSIYVV